MRAPGRGCLRHLLSFLTGSVGGGSSEAMATASWFCSAAVLILCA